VIRKNKFKSGVQVGVLATSILGLALIALGVGFFAPTGEQSKLAYDGNLWCVSNYLEKEPTEYLEDGRPAIDPLLDANAEWIRRDQVDADSAEAAMAKATRVGFFERSTKDEMRAALTGKNEVFFTHHYNEGATMPGPCWGSGSSANAHIGYWINDALLSECFGETLPDTAASGAISSGNCKMRSETISLIGKGKVSLPSSGKIVQEQHLVTKEENFQPTSVNDRISNHYTITEKAIGQKYEHKKVWTPAEGGGSIGGGSGSAPMAAVEPWVMNMYWSKKPVEGTKVIIKNPGNGKVVVAAAGYETGPASGGYLLGAQEEVMQALGATTNATVEVGFAADQSLPYGPITCTSTAKSSSSLVSRIMDKVTNFVEAITTSRAEAAGETIVIDPGHGSVANSRSYEGKTELEIGLKLENALKKAGYNVVMTHTSVGETVGGVKSGENADNEARAKIANDANAALTVRLHSDDRSDDRYSVLYPNVKGTDVTGHTGPSDSSVITKSQELASKISSALSSAGFSGSTIGENGGLGSSRQIQIFSSHANAAVVTVELYGHDDPDLRKKYAQSETQDKVAQALADGIGKYLGSSPSATKSKTKSSATASAGVICPTSKPSKGGPTAGEDQIDKIASSIAKQYPDTSGVGSAGGPDVATEQMIVEEAMKLAPGADGKTKYKYSVAGRGPNTFDCSGFVDYVLKKVRARGGNVDISSNIYTRSYARVGTVVNQIDTSKFTLSSGGAKLRAVSDLPTESLLRPGDILFFGTSTACPEGAKQCPNKIGHMGIYLGNGKFIHSTTSDKDLNKDSASKGNSTSSPALSAHSEGSLYSSYNGVKIDSLSDSYFTPGLYIQTNRVTHEISGGTYNGPWGETLGLGKTANPGGSSESISYSSCHGSSACHPGERSGHGVYNNRADSSSDRKNSIQGDAIDVTPSDGMCHAVFDGTASSGGSGRNSYTVLTSANGRVKAYYYHTLSKKTGVAKVGDAICSVGAADIGHIHFELLVDGKSVNGDRSKRSNETAYMESLWANMKRVLGLP